MPWPTHFLFSTLAPRKQHLKHPRRLTLLLFSTITLLLLLLSTTSSPKSPHLRILPEELPPHTCPPTPPLYVFLHLHKTAGNALKRALFAHANLNNLRLHHTCHSTRPDNFWQAWWFNRRKSAGVGFDCNLSKLAALSTSRRAIIDIIIGHQHLGVHAFYPRRPVRYMTMLRDPLSRKVSHFRHFERNGTQSQLIHYLIERNRNYMTKRLATDGYTGEIMSDVRSRFIDVEAFATRAALRAAKRNLLTRFFFVGLQERHEESMCLLSAILKQACGRYGHMRHVLRTRDSKQEGDWGAATQETLRALPDHVLTAARRAEGADAELYVYGKQLFEERMARYPECERKEVMKY